LITNSEDIIKNSNIVKYATVNPDLAIHSDTFISENNAQSELSDLFIPVSQIDSNIERFSTGAKSLDYLLGGGLEPKTITQFYGPPGSGKTQLCFTLCTILPPHFKCIYIDTEGTFRPERIKQIATARKTNISLQNIFVRKVSTIIELENCIDNIDKKIESDPSIKIIIIDCMVNLYKVEYSGSAKLLQRQQQLNKYMHTLRQLAQTQNIVVVITNQVYSDYSSSATNQKDKPCGGHTMNYPCTNIIKLSKSNNYSVTAELIKSPCHACDITCLEIDEKGISDDEESIKRYAKIPRYLESNRK
jgi:DNA repair protein RadA